MKKFLQKTAIGFATSAIALAIFGAPADIAKVSADSGSASYSYFLGSEPLCSFVGPEACPDTAMAPNGDTVAITGTGTLGIHPKAVTGNGTFTHKNANGDVLATGTWTATKLIEFNSYGDATPQGLPATFFGGFTQIQVHLSPEAGGSGFDGILQINCTLGNPPAGVAEGVRLDVPGVIHFNKQVSGDTLFTSL